MQQIILRELSAFNLIIEKHIRDFEKQVMDVYFDVAENKDDLFGLPHLVNDMLYCGNPKYLLAGIQSYESGNEEYFFNATAGMTDSEEKEYIITETYEYFENYATNHLLAMYHEDIETVLDHHNLCFVNTVAIPFSYEVAHQIQNPPFTEVW
jgi:hypothetical protein